MNCNQKDLFFTRKAILFNSFELFYSLISGKSINLYIDWILRVISIVFGPIWPEGTLSC